MLSSVIYPQYLVQRSLTTITEININAFLLVSSRRKLRHFILTKHPAPRLLSISFLPREPNSNHFPKRLHNPFIPLPSLSTIIHDLMTHYTCFNPSTGERALVRDLVHDWNDRRLLAYWKCLEHHPRRAVEIVRLMGLYFGEGKTEVLVERALGRLKRYPRRERFEVVARAVQQVGNADEVLGLEDPQFVLSCSQVVGEGL